MVNQIKTHSLGKLEIFIAPAHKISSGKKSLLQRLFPKTAYMHIIRQARKEGILNASSHSTHTSFTSDGKIAYYSAEGDNSKLAMCVELIDKKEKLQHFFLGHKDILEGKIVIYKEVEYWDFESERGAAPNQ